MKRLLVLAAILATTAATPAATPAVHIKNDAFTPATLRIVTGQTVTFINDDDDAHTVTAIDNSYDSKGLDTGARWSYTFRHPGTYRYFCELHPFMKATIIVTGAK